MLGTLRGREDCLPAVPPKTIGRAPARPPPRSAAAWTGRRRRGTPLLRHHTGEVEQQRARDAVEVPGLSPAALGTLDLARNTAHLYLLAIAFNLRRAEALAR